MNTQTIRSVLPLIEEYVAALIDPLAVEETGGNDPFKVLLSCILSLRTREETTRPAAKRLFSLASTAEEMAHVPVKEIALTVYPVGFYRRKAQTIHDISIILIERFHGRVPPDMDALLELPGVGRKTANLVLSVAFDIPAICVDTHVHRIMNRFGYVATRTPHETEQVLRKKLPAEYWKSVNRILVLFGRNLCTPRSPKCPSCPLVSWCEQIGVCG